MTPMTDERLRELRRIATHPDSPAYGAELITEIFRLRLALTTATAPHPTNCACPDCESDERSMSDLAIRLQEIENRLDALESKLNTHESGIDADGNPLPDTFADRLRHVERQIFQLQSERPIVKELREAIRANRKETLDSLTPATPEQAAPKCPVCGDTKRVELVYPQPGETHALCSCLKPGDVVSAEVANMLSVGSRVFVYGYGSKDAAWTKTVDELSGWEFNCKNEHYGPTLINLAPQYTILRIGPAPVAPEPTKDAACRGCGKPLDPKQFGLLADGCPCNSSRGINHGIVPTNTCTCHECDPTDSGSARRPQAPAPESDICERWGKAIRTRHAETENYDECLRRLGLPEMEAVCEAARMWRKSETTADYRIMQAAVDALDAKEAANGKA